MTDRQTDKMIGPEKKEKRNCLSNTIYTGHYSTDNHRICYITILYSALILSLTARLPDRGGGEGGGEWGGEGEVRGEVRGEGERLPADGLASSFSCYITVAPPPV